ncbi:MAG: DUF202 domain-containing protein [Bryobacterales bacterium]
MAIDRTELANERTLLAYIRTSLALFLTGVSAMQLPSFDANPAFDDFVYQAFGSTMVAAAVATILIGWVRYRRMLRRIATADEPDN